MGDDSADAGLGLPCARYAAALSGTLPALRRVQQQSPLIASIANTYSGNRSRTCTFTALNQSDLAAMSLMHASPEVASGGAVRPCLPPKGA